jgi:hypothetical protein
MLVVVLGVSAFMGCGTGAQDSCEAAVDHLAACGVTGLAVETCDPTAEQEAQEVLGQDCDSLTDRATSSFYSNKCFMGWSTKGKCCKLGYDYVEWLPPGTVRNKGPKWFVCKNGYFQPLCEDPDGHLVGVGTTNGPDICRPDGTWGRRPTKTW